MKLISWNVNGIRACLKKDFIGSMQTLDADIFGLQETKCQADTLPEIELDYPYRFFNYAEKKGYSGTAIFSRIEPVEVTYDFDGHDNDEGRVITADFGKFKLVNVYVPNSGDGLKRLSYRTTSWDVDFRAYLADLAVQGPLILCGDLNVAHREIDLKNPDRNRRSAGFTDEEREQFGCLLEAGFTDTFRHFYPEKEDAYSWWSYRTRARERNAGWRIDYFLTNEPVNKYLQDATIHSEIHGSDHCPVGILLDDW